METKRCSFCGKTVLAISTVCKHCGKSFDEIQIFQEETTPETSPIEQTDVAKEVPTIKRIETKKCPVCGKTILADSEICKHCGKTSKEPVQDENPKTTIFHPLSQSINNEPTSFKFTVPTSESNEKEPTESSQVKKEEPENNESSQNEGPALPQTTPTPVAGQDHEHITRQNSNKSRTKKTSKRIIYVVGTILLIGGTSFGLLNMNKPKPQKQELIQPLEEDTVTGKENKPSYMGLDPTIRYSAPSEMLTSSGEHFNVEAGDFFIGVVDKNGNPENGKLYDKSGYQKHIILPKSDH